MKVTDKNFNLEKIKKTLLALKKKELQVGIFEDSGVNEDTGGRIVDYAIANEYGTSKIPERPFMRSTADEKQENWSALMDKIVEGVTKGDFEVERKIGLVGEQMVNDIKEKISSNVPPPLNPATIKRKGSSRTLIDTGNMRNSITFKITDK